MSGQADDPDLLAAEFVLGAMEPAEAHTLVRRAQDDPVLASAIRQWQERLDPLNELAGPAAPDPTLWERLQAEVGGDARSLPRRGVWSRPGLWRATTFAAVGLAASLALWIVSRPKMPTAGRDFDGPRKPAAGRNRGRARRRDSDLPPGRLGRHATVRNARSLGASGGHARTEAAGRRPIWGRAFHRARAAFRQPAHGDRRRQVGGARKDARPHAVRRRADRHIRPIRPLALCECIVALH